jgi:hypothetical protein
MPMQHPLKAVETATDAVDPADCITELQTPFGYWWRYSPSSPNEPDTTLVAAIRVAATVAEHEARKSGKTFLVTTGAARWPDVYVFALDHPDARRLDLTVMYQLTPTGECIRRAATRH